MNIDEYFLPMLRCPISGGPVLKDSGMLVSVDGENKYRITESGIPLFAEEICSDEGRRQQSHYDRVSQGYLKNLTYPHTQEYMRYLDTVFLEQTQDAEFDNVAEICCGTGEAFKLLGDRVKSGIGVDVSLSMLERARRDLPHARYLFLQGDATMLPLGDNKFSSVFILGGIHHVNNRGQLFKEIFRILKSGGKLYWREPVSDFFCGAGSGKSFIRFHHP